MKKLFYLSIFLLSALTVLAQEYVFNYNRPEYIKKVFQVGNTAACLSYSEPTPSGHYYVVWGTDKQYETGYRAVFTMAEGFQFRYAKTLNSKCLLVFENTGTEEFSFVQLDDKLNILQQKMYAENQDDLHQTYGSQSVELSSEGSVFIIRAYKDFVDEKKRKVAESGIEVCRFSKDLEILWNHKIKAQDAHSVLVESVTPQNGGFKALVTQDSRKSKAFDAFILSVAADGKAVGQVSMKEGDGLVYPTIMKVDGANVLACGMYFKDSWYNAKNSEGMFFIRLDASGKELSRVLKPWEDVIEQIKAGNKNEFLFAGNMKVLVQDILPTSTGYAVIAESYTKSSGTTAGDILVGSGSKDNTRAFTVYDFLVFDFDKSGAYKGMKKLEKESRNVMIVGSAAFSRSVQLSFLLKDNQLFSYRDCDGSKLVYFNMEERVPYLFTAELATGKVLAKSEVKFGPDVVEEEDPQYESKLMQGLSDFQKGVDNATKQADALDDRINYGISRTDQVFYPHAVTASGILTFGLDEHHSFLMHPEQGLVLRKI